MRRLVARGSFAGHTMTATYSVRDESWSPQSPVEDHAENSQIARHDEIDHDLQRKIQIEEGIAYDR